ncbi:MAG: helicase-exonuclease AddAB subunit AddB, partial [Clostridia bacterium]|nr:helicase-exonuclease AddAB subunit AddB [Clostridia bacterium]
MLRLLIGRSGSGKTGQCLQEIAAEVECNPQANCFYLVPEQGSFYAEKSLLKQIKKGGVIQAQVFSFQRLAWRVLQETGGGIIPPLDDVGKTLILKHILTKNKNKFQVFAKVMDKPGFLEQLVRALSEMKNYCLSPEKLAGCLGESGAGLPYELEGKLAEFVFIYREFEQYIEQEYLDTDDNLQLLADHLYKADFLKTAQVWIDGFHGFTPLEFAVIKELLLYCRQVKITLCLDPECLQQKLSETHLFFKPWETYQSLLEMAAEIQCPPADVLVLPEPRRRRFQKTTELAFLEESFIQTKPVFREKAGALKLRAAVNRQEEVEEAAREILFLCREKGLRYQDIAVLLRDFTNYENLITNIFRDYEIPFFLDMKKPVRHHPLPDLIQSVLEVVQGGWNYEPLFRCLKTDLFPLSRRETDLLENYCLAHGIRGSRWTDGKPWQFKTGLAEGRGKELLPQQQQLLRRVNKVREKVVEILLPLQEAWQTASKGREYSEILFSFLDKIAVAKKLERWSIKAEEKGELEEARIHTQVWQKVLELLDRLVEVLGDQAMSLQEFSQVMTGGLETLELGLIPPCLDQVLVGSVERSRNPDLKAVIILGVNEGVFPARVVESGLFNDQDRLLLAEQRIALAPTTEKRLYAEQFLIYKALTTAGQYLTLSFALADAEGKALTASPLLLRVRTIFPQAELALEPEKESAGEKAACPRSAFSYLAVSLRQAKEGEKIATLWWDVYNWYLNRQEWQQPLAKIVEGLFYQQEVSLLPSPLVRRLYGQTLRTSISRLEMFRACPFAHFLTYGLQLQERAEHKVASPDLGQFFHAGLENFYRYLQEKNLVWGELTAQERQEIVGGIVEKLAPRLQNEVLLSTARYRYLTGKLKRILLRAVTVLGEHEQRGAFRPLGMEMSFGEKGDLPGLNFTLANGTKIEVQGRIDRLDAAPVEQDWYLRVIDYKSGQASLNLTEVFYGLKLQLLTYLTVALTQSHHLLEGEVRPGGVLYFPIKDPLIIAQGPLSTEEVEKKIFVELKMQGYLLQDPAVVKLMDREIAGYSNLLPVALNKKGEFYKNVQNVWTDEEFGQLCHYAEKLLREIGTEIMSGKVTVQPYRYQGKEPCTYCPYPAVCKFDPIIPGNAYQILQPREAEEIWSEIRAAGAIVETE